MRAVARAIRSPLRRSWVSRAQARSECSSTGSARASDLRWAHAVSISSPTRTTSSSAASATRRCTGWWRSSGGARSLRRCERSSSGEWSGHWAEKKGLRKKES
eukprot:47794-Prymnesium_polylepis.1